MEKVGVFTTLLLIAMPALFASAATDLSAKYPFYRTLFDDQGQYYGLYWNYSIAAKTIHFAVNVSTEGWVGLGLSPNGQMPNSDVVIGWVDVDSAPGRVYFDDRFADGRALPPVDESQDWFIISGREENSFTTLEFSRNLTTCDDRDLEIKPDTARVIWSFSTTDPANNVLDSATPRHQYQGVTSINLLGGLTTPPEEPTDVEYFDVIVDNVIIPVNDTTYWCESIQLDADFENSTKYIIRTSPVITSHTRSFVHHMLIYLCPHELSEELVGESGPCNQVHRNVSNCRNGETLGAWAVGGEDFVFPSNAAYPTGGPGAGRHIVIEMHYDNPNMEQGVVDSSGMRFYYTSTPREHNAAMLALGHSVSTSMLIPPNAVNYTIAGLCSSACTSKFLPEGGIHIFGIFLHTHLAGRALELQHLRWNPDCDVYEELPPIVFNPSYDFDYQQFLHLPNEVTVLPGDILISKCIYGTKDRSGVTFGGLSTREEMCLITPVYYPYIPTMPGLDFCISNPISPFSFQSFEDMIRKRNPLVSTLWDQGRIEEGLNAIDWSSDTIQSLEDTVLNGLVQVICASDDDYIVDYSSDGIPQSKCPYMANDTCKSFVPKPCCERLEGTEPTTGAAAIASKVHYLALAGLFFISLMLTAMTQ